MSTGEFYDPDDVLPRSPGLQPTKVNYRPVDSPPPFTAQPSSSVSSSPEPSDSGRLSESKESGAATKLLAKRKTRRRKGRTRPSQGDAVLISYLDPNRPDIAQQVGQHALNSASQSEYEYEDDDIEAMSIDEPTEHDRDLGLATKASEALAAIVHKGGNRGKGHFGQEQPKTGNVGSPSTTNGAHVSINRISEYAQQPQIAKFDLKPPPKLNAGDAVKDLPGSPSQEAIEDVEDSSGMSPNLAKYTISPSDANPETTLPAMQKSPARSSSANSPDGLQNLPSLQTTLSQISAGEPNGFSTYPSMSQSPTAARNVSLSYPSSGPSPGMFSAPSPAMSPPDTRTPYFYSNPRQLPPQVLAVSTPSTLYDAPTPSAMPIQSPASSAARSYPTPNEQDHQTNMETDSASQINGEIEGEAQYASGNFRCTFHGCTAAPFQTQYLLNSHANVHSSNRPHFCHVKECPRGPGGKGFKRKNEMIRHGK